ncbi:tetraspanin-9-like isoform X2 [Ostrea edulis]|uniref:tetraspanin-9-like isoform X2 n=1 Tax=Ostrea edulis TaxID=37623 RepID=UPI002095B548|nr:tetraspanin-9-like isoform X2 [Ostrea edulis]XP_056013364.1 tetraspanin-9-like isoform X2 [Ostrea edulis]
MRNSSIFFISTSEYLCVESEWCLTKLSLIMGLGCGGKLGMIFLIVINTIFFIFGIGVLIVGVLALEDVADLNKDHIKPVLDTITVNSFQVGDLATNLSIILIVIGAFIFIISSLGLIGACCQNKCMLVTYAILVLILLVMKIVIIALWFTMQNKVEEEIKSKMLTSLKENFKSDDTTNSNSVSNAWNYLFMSLDCCAVDPVTSTTNDFDQTTWCTTIGSCQATNSDIPKTCCKGVDENTYSTAPTSCHSSVTPGTYNTKGCYDALKDLLTSRSPSIIGVSVSVMVLEILSVVFAFIVCKGAGTDTVV